MSYISYINQFWQVVKTGSVPSSAVAVYFYLLHVCNSVFWKMPFSCSTTWICEKLRITRETFTNARRFLADRRLISFTEGSSRFNHPTYTILQLTDNMTEQQTAEATEDLTEGLTDDLTHIYSKDRDNRLTKREMAIPSVAEVESYMATCVIPDGYVLKEGIPQRFCDYYNSNGWMVSNTPMADWKACARKWTKDTKNLTKKDYGTEKRYSESGRVDNRVEAKNYVEELEQRSLRSANRK